MMVSHVRARGVPAAAVASAALALFISPVSADAQTSLSVRPLHVGDCQVVVQVTNPRAGDQVGVVVELTESREQTLVAGRTELTFALGEPLRQGFRVRTRLNGVNGKDEVVPAGGGPPKGECVAAAAPDESPFDASVFLGTVIDNFAPDKVGDYKNPEAGTKQKAQFIAGFDFDYRLYGRADSKRRVWIQGQTMHGVRTADINCEPRDDQGNIDTSKIPPVCSTETPFQDRVRFILENATSIEAFVSPRFEFLKIQDSTDSAAWLYTTMNIGFIALKDAPKVFRTMHVGLGLLADEGNFAGSYFEVGWGRNELFSPKWNRLNIDGLLSFSLDRLPLVRDNGRLFVEMTVDNDLHDGPDSVRTFFGVDVDLRKALGQ
jgi:hypothetical protein